MIKEVLNYNACVQTKAMRDGIKCEKLAITEVTVVLKLKIVGFFVAKNHGFLVLLLMVLLLILVLRIWFIFKSDHRSLISSM